MAKRQHINMICRFRKDHNQIQVWNSWREKKPDIIPNMEGANFSGIIFSNWRDWEKGDWFIANLARVILKSANLRQVDLTECNIEEAILIGADLFEADLKEAIFNGANLSRADLSCTIAVNTFFQKANLKMACLRRADIRLAHFDHANLCGANLFEAHLSEAGFCNADLRMADMRNTDMNKTNLEGASLAGTLVQGADLRFARGITEKQIAEAVTDIKTKLPKNKKI